MKKITPLAMLILISVFAFTSCRKEGTTITKVINVSLNVNQDYSYQVPSAGDKDDIMQITKQAEHFAKSTATEVSGVSGVKFEYTPALNYAGNDEVQINNVEGQHGGHGMHGGNCSGHGHDDVTIYDFKITIVGNVK